MRDHTATPELRPAPTAWTLYIHSGMDRQGAYGGGLFTCVGRDLWQADDGWTHRAGFFEQPTPPDAPHPATGSLWVVSDMARETGSITALMLRPATEEELPLIRERAAWDRRRSAAFDAWNAISYDDYPAKHAAMLAGRAVEAEHFDWLPEWQRKCILQTLAEEAAIPSGIPEPAEWSLYIEGVDRQEAYGGGLYRCVGRREWRADAGWSHFDTPTPPDAPHPAPGSLWMVSGMKPDSRDLRTVVQLLPASPADMVRIREQEAARLQRRADVQAGREGCAGDLVHWQVEFSGVKRPWTKARPPFWWSSYRKGLWEAGYSERHAKFLRGDVVS